MIKSIYALVCITTLLVSTQDLFAQRVPKPVTQTTTMYFTGQMSQENIGFLFPPKYNLPDGKLTPKQICGRDRCLLSVAGREEHYYHRAYSPPVNDNSTLLDIAFGLIGHLVPVDQPDWPYPYSCSNGSTSPFLKEDITPKGSATGHKIDYKKTEQLQLNVTAAVKANLEEIAPLIKDNKLLDSLKVELTAAYTKISGKTLTITGNYSEWQLSNPTINKITKGTDYIECKKYIADHGMRIIVAVGIINYSITKAETNLEDLTSSIQAKLDAHKIPISIGVSFKKQVSSSLNSSTAEGYQVISTNTLGAKDLNIANK